MGRAGIHTINQDHAAVGPLRAILSPIGMLRETVESLVGDAEVSMLLFGSVARDEATSRSDVDLAVIAPPGWDQRVALEDAVRARLGIDCEVLVFTPSEFADLSASGEPVVIDILRDGIPLVGTMPSGVRGSV
ncbi:nucleotidyltransferase domain-containing protein [Sanguibacter sp. Z1732]|uniref:nucleotidyltransferase domain-containing protein n=1 Tax=Sanguibacter sp. Z1732 TaxID=3435412 RepID=UPI003D9CA2E3